MDRGARFGIISNRAEDPETVSVELLLEAGARRGLTGERGDVADPALVARAPSWRFALARTCGPGQAHTLAPVAARTVLVPGLEATFGRD